MNLSGLELGWSRGAKRMVAALLGVFWTRGIPCAAQTRADPNPPTCYLAFQVFTASPPPLNPSVGASMQEMLPPTRDLDGFARDLVSRIGAVGAGKRRLAISFGLLAFDNPDAQVQQLIAKAFDIGLKYNVAVGFHIDDSMFWGRRRDLLNDPANVEWVDWSGIPSTGRRIDWGPHPTKIAPQMCFNSPAIRIAVRQRGWLIGRAIQAGRARLKNLDKEELFWGVIAGSETMIGQDFDTKMATGFHALANLGFSRTHMPKDVDAARAGVVQTFIRLWATSIATAGVPRDQIYCHLAFLPQKIFDQSSATLESYTARNHFAPPSVAFGNGCRPGFSTYPQPGLFQQIASERYSRGEPAWASSEGTNLQLGAGPGQSGMNMETYLAKMFNHGAAVVNLYSWGLGGDANRHMDFRVVTEGPEAIGAYRKFLHGDLLVESADGGPTILERLPDKIRRIQATLPGWVQKNNGQARAEPLMEKLDAALKENNLAEAEKVADQILQMIAG